MTMYVKRTTVAAHQTDEAWRDLSMIETVVLADLVR
jgi:hypothetical protein